ncbi:hypothetical protein Gogos_019129 [Gossypium gossypioides]|uniref:Uncharacterized protein n=1 Tax=Gossypium gossypioides TaxID=34282 RepID=A0A7J9BGI1_GOSGO|nr:hypothetical protein [Gossypium gossypioides]
MAPPSPANKPPPSPTVAPPSPATKSSPSPTGTPPPAIKPPPSPTLTPPPPAPTTKPPPSPIVPPPPRHHLFHPPPPPHSISLPSPPHVIPPPLPPSGHHSTVIVIVFVSIGGLFFFAFLSIALFCFIKKRKKKTVQKTEILSIDEHVKVQEAIVPGPHGAQNAVLLVEDDIRIDEEIKKNKKTSEGLLHSHLKSLQEISHSQACDGYGGTKAS